MTHPYVYNIHVQGAIKQGNRVQKETAHDIDRDTEKVDDV